jgi:mono/diheme cytochrome c family protein
MKKLSTLILITVATFVALPALAADGGGDAKTLFVETHKCNLCHGVSAAGVEAKTKSEKMAGPDLSGFHPDKSAAEIAAFLRKESEKDGQEHKKEFKGTDEELQAILDWLGSLEAAE